MKQSPNAWRVLQNDKGEACTYNDGTEYKVKNNTNSTYIMVGGKSALITAQSIAQLLTQCEYGDPVKS